MSSLKFRSGKVRSGRTPRKTKVAKRKKRGKLQRGSGNLTRRGNPRPLTGD